MPRGKRPPGERELERWPVVTKLDLVAWSTVVFVPGRECRLSLNYFPVIAAFYVTALRRRPQAPDQNGKPGTVPFHVLSPLTQPPLAPAGL